MSVFTKPYEISLWEDRLVLVDTDGKEHEDSISDQVEVAISYYKEIKLCVIGANDFDNPIKAVNPQLKRNINGQNTLTFSIYSKYYDEDSESLIDNPFIKFLTNERKVKLKYQLKDEVKWLDFIIKNISEDSSSHLFTYTATDLFINELSKTGFNLQFDPELENNQGTVNELGEKILAGTDWQIGEDSEIIQQFQEEALYKIVLNKSIIAINVLNPDETKTIPKGAVIYTFYSCITNQEEEFFQFIYNEDGFYEIDEKRVILNGNGYYFTFTNPANEAWPYFAETVEYINEYRGERIVRSQENRYDPLLEQYVKVYTDSTGKEIYGYEEVEYITDDIIQSYITNGSEYVSSSGWRQNSLISPEMVVVPDYKNFPTYKNARTSTLKIEQTEDNFLFNSGIRDNASLIKGFSKNEEYVFRLKCGTLGADKVSLICPTARFRVQVKTYEFTSDGHFAKDNDETQVLFDFTTGKSNERDPQGYFIGRGTCKLDFSQKDLQEKKIGIFITAVKENSDLARTDLVYHLQDAQFFKYVLDADNNQCYPHGYVSKTDENGIRVIVQELKSYVKTNYFYYYPDATLTSAIDITYISTDKKNEDYKPKFNSNYEKIRSITASETNRFNLLQTLSETFECWCKIDVKHKDTGEIMLGKDCEEKLVIDGGSSIKTIDQNGIVYDANSATSVERKTVVSNSMTLQQLYQPQKFISFHKNVGQKSNIGFVYGINLKSIKRSLESNNIVTKLIVKNNNNEFATAGSCSIARAKENPNKDNFLLDFSYYINQGLLNYENFYNELYSLNSERGWTGFYARLKSINSQIEEKIEQQDLLQGSLVKCNSECSSYQVQYDQGVDLLREKEDEFFQKTTVLFDDMKIGNTWLTDETIVALGNEIARLRIENNSIKKLYDRAKENQKTFEEDIDKIKQEQADLLIEKQELIEVFENKYIRFIQEGPWNSDDYIDDNLYYLDAESTLHNSSQPKVEYTVNVLDINRLEGYENYVYDLGDITYIQDTEYFGWTYKDGIKTPYKEKIVVTETVIDFDSPEKDTIKVQNYRTQFEDLFQRLAAATQRVEFYSGAYDRAADVIKPDGTIDSEVLADAFSNNNHLLQNAQNQSVTWDGKGITTTNLRNPAEIVRITSGGVFVSDNGGQNWSTGITGQGINAKTITTGSLNTELITVMNGSQPSFRWDKTGINAYESRREGYNNKTYVRFDQYGIYGVTNTPEAPTSLEEILDKANFSLTWRGFKLKTGGAGGSVVIDSDNDFAVYAGGTPKPIVQMGRFKNDKDEEDYGFLIRDKDGKIGFRATKDSLMAGGWEINQGGLYNKYIAEDGNEYVIGLFARKQSSPMAIVNENGSKIHETQEWRIYAGGKFGVDFSGNMFATNATISGTINATSGTIGGLVIDEFGKLTIPGDMVVGEVVRAAAIEIKDKNTGAIIFKADDGTTDEDKTTINPEVYMAGWKVDTKALYTEGNVLYLGTSGIETKIGNTNVSNIVFKAGDNFGVTKAGKVYANNISVTGGKIGQCTFDSEGNLQIPKEAIIGDITAKSIVVKDTSEKLVFSALSETGEVQIGGWKVESNSLSTTGLSLNSAKQGADKTLILETTSSTYDLDRVEKVEVKEVTDNPRGDTDYLEFVHIPDQGIAYSCFKNNGNYSVKIIDSQAVGATVTGVTVRDNQIKEQVQDGKTTYVVDYDVAFTGTIDKDMPLYITVEIDFEYTETIEEKGFQIQQNGAVSFFDGTLGTWKVYGDQLIGERYFDNYYGAFCEPKITNSGIQLRVYESSESNVMKKVKTVPWGLLCAKLTLI